MSQFFVDITSGVLPPSVATLYVENTGSAVPAANVLNVFGSSVAAGTTPVSTTGSGNTVTTNVQTSQAIASTNATNIGLAAFNSAQFTVDANGFVSLVGGGGGAVETITGNSGGPESPLAGNFNILGTGSITVAGTANTETISLTGLTNHAVLVGAGTATITKVGPSATTGQILQNNAAADPTYSTATYPSTTTVSQILYSSATNVVSGLATANNATLTTGATGIPVLTSFPSNGSLLIGSASGPPLVGTLTAGTGISITNAANSITIAATATGVGTWTDETSSFNAVASNGYFIAGNATATLPASPTQGQTIAFFVDGAFTLTIQANTGQTIQFNTNTSSSAGTQTNTASGDSATLVYRASDTSWKSTSYTGAWNKT